MLLLLACAPPEPLPTEVETEGGTWVLTLAETTFDRGDQHVALHVAEGDAPADDLRIFAAPGMADMSHSLPLVDFEGADGAYTGAFTFDMTGLWMISGYVRDSATTEAFTFWVEVLL